MSPKSASNSTAFPHLLSIICFVASLLAVSYTCCVVTSFRSTCNFIRVCVLHPTTPPPDHNITIMSGSKTSSTPTISQLIETLSSKSSEIKQHMCNKTKKQSFSDINVSEDICGTGKKSITKDYLAKSVINLIEIIDDIDFIMKPINASDIFDIIDINTSNKLYSDVQKQLAECAKVTETATQTITAHKADIDERLKQLNEVVSSLSVNNNNSPPRNSENYDYDCVDSTQNPVNHELKYISATVDNFIKPDACCELLDLLSKEEFTPEGGHSVVTYGEQYKYGGHKIEPKLIPSCIQNIMDTVNDAIKKEGGDYKLNSCLANKFDGPESSLSEHSDDEYSINPESDIYTVSLGVPRTVVFKDTFSGLETDFVAQPNSVYIMSRNSQSVYRHRIDRDTLCTGVRYSLTFRCVSWRYLNSTCLIGDSNTRDIVFGEGKGTMGASTPGKQVYTPRIEMINPLSCASYKNVVLALGVNDIKQDNIRNLNDVKSVYNEYKSKVMEIQRLNSRSKIFVVPALPTKSMSLNRRILDFDDLLINDLPRSCNNVSSVTGISRFVDNRELLKESLSKKPDDLIHINAAGRGLFVKMIKLAIFDRKRGRQDSRPFSAVAKAPGGGAGATS